MLALALLSLAAPGLAPAARAASTHPFQIEAALVGSQPFGTLSSGDKLSDAFGFGGNASGSAWVRMSRGLWIGARAAYLKSQHDFTFTYRPSFGAPPVSAPATQTLNSIPVLAMVPVRGDPHRRLGLYGEGGLGVTTFNSRIVYSPVGFEPQSFFQLTVSYLLGGGVTMAAGRNVELLVSTDYLQSFAGQGDVFQHGDNPAYFMVSLGARYPRW